MNEALDEAKDQLIATLEQSLSDITVIVEELCVSGFADSPRLREFREEIGAELEFLANEIKDLHHRTLVANSLALAKTIEAGKARAGR